LTLEEFLSELNEFYFFKEFTYTKNLFRTKDGREVEVADNILAIDDLYIAFQLKQRNEAAETTAEKENNWFSKKVLKKATKQIRDTIKYFQEYDEVILTNNQGHSFNLATSKVNKIHKVIVFKAGKELPDQTFNTKYYTSRSVGIIHIIPDNDYLGIVKYLLTPPEVHDYLTFREKFISKWGEKIRKIPEAALVGQYLTGDEETEPNIQFKSALVALKHDIESWDMTGVIKTFPDKMINYESSIDYYSIVRELAKLMRNDLKAFKERFTLSMKAAKENKFCLPYRFALPRTNCAFLFIPLEKEFEDIKRQALKNLSIAHKYDVRMQRCIAATFIYHGNNYYDVDWCFMDFPWEFNSEIEERLKNDFPFRKVKEKMIQRYEFK